MPRGYWGLAAGTLYAASAWCAPSFAQTPPSPAEPQTPPPPTQPQTQPPPPQTYPEQGYNAQQVSPPPRPRAYFPPPPAELEYDEGMAIPPGYRKVERTRTGLVLSGSIVLGVSYAISVSDAFSTEGETGWLAVPVAGPFIMSSQLECDTEFRFDCEPSLSRELLILYGIGQLTGATLLTIGIAATKEVLVRDGSELGQARIGPIRIGKDGYGLGAQGRF